MKTKESRLNGCYLIDLPKFSDQRGSLSVIESQIHVPFDIKRVFYLYHVPSESTRAAHAHRTLIQFIVPISGSFDVILDDGENKVTYRLDRPEQGLYICPMIWNKIINFSENSACMVLASQHYDEADYYRNYDNFLNAVKQEE